MALMRRERPSSGVGGWAVPGGILDVREWWSGWTTTHVSSHTRRMGLDVDLVRDAEAARGRLVAAQHAAEQAKADYHHAIRRLHAAGGSLREIAEALRLSHQRVHQIIDESDQPRPRWWQRRGRTETEPAAASQCSFCGRSREECAKLIAGPGLCICDWCVRRARGLASGAATVDQAEVPLRVEPSGSPAGCSFCGKPTRRGRWLVASGVASAPGGKFGQEPRICSQCLGLCEEILAETASR
jgi:hypothetical protein